MGFQALVKGVLRTGISVAKDLKNAVEEGIAEAKAEQAKKAEEQARLVAQRAEEAAKRKAAEEARRKAEEEERKRREAERKKQEAERLRRETAERLVREKREFEEALAATDAAIAGAGAAWKDVQSHLVAMFHADLEPERKERKARLESSGDSVIAEPDAPESVAPPTRKAVSRKPTPAKTTTKKSTSAPPAAKKAPTKSPASTPATKKAQTKPAVSKPTPKNASSKTSATKPPKKKKITPERKTMKLESENLPETTATPELIEALLRDDERRGPWLVLSDEADDGSFVQTAEDGDGFALEWRNGSDTPLQRVSRVLSRDETLSAFLAFLAGDTKWTSHYDWTDVALSAE